jgi:hypothetical protein
MKNFRFLAVFVALLALACNGSVGAAPPMGPDYVVVVNATDEVRSDRLLTSLERFEVKSAAVRVVKILPREAFKISAVCSSLRERFQNARVVFAPSSGWKLSAVNEISQCERTYPGRVVFYTYEGFFKKKNTKRVIYLPLWPQYRTGVLISELVGTKRVDFIASGNEFRYWKSTDVPEDSAAMYENAASQGITVVPHRIDARTQEAEDQIAQICKLDVKAIVLDLPNYWIRRSICATTMGRFAGWYGTDGSAPVPADDLLVALDESKLVEFAIGEFRAKRNRPPDTLTFASWWRVSVSTRVELEVAARARAYRFG